VALVDGDGRSSIRTVSRHLLKAAASSYVNVRAAIEHLEAPFGPALRSER
jgi:hypothetical protein